MSTQKQRVSALREILKSGKTSGAPAVHDCLSALLAEQAGFPFVFTSGFGISASRLGLPDHGYLTATENLDTLKNICSAINIPVIADIDTGYGNESNVRRTITNAISNGVAGVLLEDQVWPKRCGHLEGKQVISADEYIHKLKAAIDARGDDDLVIVSRTDSLAVHGFDEAIRRGKLYEEAGADVLFVEAPESVEQLETISKTFPKIPLMANMIEGGKTPCLSLTELNKLGFTIVAYALTGLFSMTDALQKTYRELIEKEDVTAISSGQVDFGSFMSIINRRSS